MPISRSVKAGGSTDVQSGQTIHPSDINTDMNTVFAKFDAGIVDADISASAAISVSKLALTGAITSAMLVDGTIVNADVNANADIALTKLADISGAASDAATATDPGASNSESLATTGAGEIERLRYAIERLALGINAGRFDATGTLAATYWGDVPVRALQWLPGFNGPVTSGLPTGWTNVGTATLAQEAADAADATAGKGRAIKITASGSANEGISYTLSGLKAATRYAIYAIVKATTGDTVRLVTTGADATSAFRDVTATSTSTAWTVLSAVVQTDATPTDLVVKIDTGADGDIVWCAGVCFGECSATPTAPRVAVVGSLTGSTAGTQVIDAGSDAGVDAGYRIVESGTTDFDVTVYVPGDGYYIEVESKMTFGDTASQTGANDVVVKLYRSVNGGALSAVDTSALSREATNSAQVSWYMVMTSDFVATPNPGQSYRYVVAATRTSHNVTPQKAHGTRGATTSWLRVRCLPYGG